MKTTKKRWTKQEEDIIIQEIKKCPYNRVQAFKNAQELLPHRSYHSIRFRWYNYLSNPKNKKYRGINFMLVSNKKAVSNRTQLYTENNSNFFVVITKKIKNLINNLFN